jgi:MFS transporter, ACS family, tartrate transporter
MMFVTGARSFYAARILLGIAEAGFFPGFVLYLTYWIPAADRARTGALFMMAAPVSIIVGAPVSEALLKLDGQLGLHGWQWLFALEGLPAIVLGLVALRVLTDRPEQATWLAPADRDWLAATMNEERAVRAHIGHASLRRTMASGRVWVLCLVYFLNTSVSYGIFLWIPKMLREASGASGFGLSGLTALPFTAALLGMFFVGRHSDRTGERKFHVAACAATAAVGLLLAAAFQNNIWLLVLSFTLSQIGQRSVMSVFWAIPPLFLGGVGAAAGIGLINAVGNLGGAAGPTMMGWLRDVTGGYAGGLLVLTAVLVAEAVIVSALRLPQTVAPLPAAKTAV